MSATQEFVWTCLPNGLTSDRRGLRVSVLVSPRLHPVSDAPVLATFREWLDWPSTLKAATFTFVADGQTVARHRVSDTGVTPSTTVWQALMHKNVPVNGEGPDTKLLKSEILSYSATDIHDMVRELYRDLGTRTKDSLPAIGPDLLRNSVWGPLIAAVADVDNWGAEGREPRVGSLPPGRGLTQIDRRFDGFPRLPALKAGSAGHGRAETAVHLARFLLFHTPPLPPKVITQTPRADDPRIQSASQEFERTDMPDKAALAHTLDFHRIVAAMNSYPALLRRLGLVLDFVIDRARVPRKLDLLLRVNAEFADGALTTRRGPRPDVTAITHTTHSDTGFFAAPTPLAASAPDTRITNGLLDLYSDPDRYAVLQADVDGAGLKVIAFARTLGAYERRATSDPAATSDDVSRKDKEAGAPALRTAGMMLVQKDRAQALKKRLASNLRQVHESGSGTTELWAEDLTRGYRIDVWDAHVARWRSLCRRTARYELAGGTVVVQPAAGEEEATVQLAVTRSPDPKYNPEILYLHEAMVSWTGWSLAAPPPGRAIADDQKTSAGGKPEFSDEAEIPPGLDFHSRFNAVPGSLPRLRYGRSYAMRARAVDLVGNSLPPSEKSFGPEKPETTAPFLRFEPLLPPVVALIRPAGGSTEAPAEGESMCRLAIRSFNDVFDDATVTAEVARRAGVPPQCTAKDAELHGMLDAGGIVDSATFQMLASDTDRDARDPAAALVEETIAQKGPLDTAPVDTTSSVWKSGAAMTYLPDPLAREVNACFVDHPTMTRHESVTIPLYPDGEMWPHAQPFTIELYEDGAAKASFDEDERVLRVPLGKGERATLRLSMRLSRDALRQMGIWQWLGPPTDPAFANDVESGRHWMFTPWQDIDIVHAVQRPLIRPAFDDLRTEREYLGATHAVPRFDALCSLKSTDRLDLLAHWDEPEDKLADAVPGNRTRDDLPFHVKITEPRDYRPAKDALPDHSQPSVADPHRIEVNSARSDRVARKRHEFNDTRYRRIEYRLKATTRYREYLPPKLQLAPDPVTGVSTPVDTHITLEGPKVVTWVRSSAPPPPPEVRWVVPTFGWTRARADDGTARSWRRGGGLRVYLDRPWSVTGYGEMLAVVLPPAGFTGDPEEVPAGRPYKKYVTQWGNDPIRESPFVAGLAPTRRDFPLARWQPDPAGGWRPPGAPAAECDQPPEAFAVTALSPPGKDASGVVEIAPHDVFYDEERQLWYCDIEVKQGRSYWPFIRLALARYQPSSLTGAHLSDVILADVMQLTADRWLTMRPDVTGRVREVTVYGPGYTDSGGAREARENPPRSERDILTGKVRFVSLAPIAQQTIVEVSLEQLDAGLGEDFGWKRIAHGEATPPPGAENVPMVRADRLSPEEVVRSTQMLEARNFRGVLETGMVETQALVQPLWNGRVTLPAATGAHDRLRIAIEEYEEYPIDGEEDPDEGESHDTMRTRVGRRLVFIEHVAVR